MEFINITNIIVKNNPAPFSAPLSFEIFFECLKPLKEGNPYPHPLISCNYSPLV
jgi:hypothetical protein